MLSAIFVYFSFMITYEVYYPLPPFIFSNLEGSYSLSMREKDAEGLKIKHYRIMFSKKDSSYFMAKKRKFKSVQKLVQFYKGLLKRLYIFFFLCSSFGTLVEWIRYNVLFYARFSMP